MSQELTNDLTAAFEIFKQGQKGKNTNIWALKDVEDALHAGIEYEKQRQRREYPVENSPIEK